MNGRLSVLDLIQQKDIIQITSTGWTEIDEKYESPSGVRSVISI